MIFWNQCKFLEIFYYIFHLFCIFWRYLNQTFNLQLPPIFHAHFNCIHNSVQHKYLVPKC